MKKKLNIEGMTCEHCASHVKIALEEICGVKSADVNLDAKSAVVELAHEVENMKFKTAVEEEAGYTLVSIENL